MSQMTEAAKKRMEEEISDYMMTHDLNNENVFSPWSFRKGVEFGAKDSNSNAEKIKELQFQLADRSEKYRIAMDKGVDILSDRIKTQNELLGECEHVLKILFEATENPNVAETINQLYMKIREARK